MKLAPILADYLFQNKHLDLPGIGTFRVEPNSHTPEYPANDNKAFSENAISFEANPSLKENPELIDFISSHTGKIKALAAADLDSHLELAHQFLNIGNPFLFEGIGSIVRTPSGRYEFVTGNVSNEKIKEYHGREVKTTSTTENSFTEYENILFPKKFKLNPKNPVIFLLLFAGIGLAVGGGYLVYKKRISGNNNVEIVPVKKEQTTSVPDSNVLLSKKAINIADAKPYNGSGRYKFVVEVAGKKRGLYRYKMLRGFGIEDVKIETKDSVQFKLFFLLPASARDTTRVMDSLRNQYTPSWSKAYVEN